jgi:hypothetical protein
METINYFSSWEFKALCVTSIMTAILIQLYRGKLSNLSSSVAAKSFSKEIQRAWGVESPIFGGVYAAVFVLLEMFILFVLILFLLVVLANLIFRGSLF